MSTFDQEHSGVQINDLSIICYLENGDVTNLNIKGIVDRIDIMENIISPVIMGTVVVTDTNNISRLLRTGSCFLNIDFSKTDSKIKYQKLMRIYKEEKRRAKNQSSESFVIYFCSEELIQSNQLIVSRSYTETYSKIASSILKDFLSVEQDRIDISKTSGVKSVVVPSLKPLDALLWCANRAVNMDNIPDFLFFENKNGFNFLSLKDIYDNESISITFSPKNTATESEPSEEFLGAKSSQAISQFNLLDSIKKGSYSSSIYGYDLITGTFFKQDISNKYYDKKAKLNDTVSVPNTVNKKGVGMSKAHDSKRTVIITDSQYKLSNYANKNYPSMKIHSPEYSLAHRSAVFSQLSKKKMKVLLPGNFNLTVGMMVDLKYPKRGVNFDNDNYDKSFAGRHLIVAVRHYLNLLKHETLIELSTDSELEN